MDDLRILADRFYRAWTAHHHYAYIREQPIWRLTSLTPKE